MSSRSTVDAVAGEERERAAQEPDRGGGLLVGEHLGVGQPGAVVDRDVDELPAASCCADAGGIGDLAARVVALAAGDALARAAARSGRAS